MNARMLIAPIAALLLTTGTLLAQPAGANPPLAQPQTLELRVIVPPSWEPMFEDRVADTLASEISDVFERSGYHGAITTVSNDEQAPGTAAARLTVNLIEWRMNIAGNIDCTFSATLQTGTTVRQLGSFSGMSFRWMTGPGRFGVSDSFTQAADDAIRQMYDAVRKSGLLPAAKH